MPSTHIVVESLISNHPRVKQLSAIFDVPITEKSRLEWDVDLQLDHDFWNVGLIVGPSGSGKTTIAKTLFKEQYHRDLQWGQSSVIEDFNSALSIQDISAVCQAVGFNTIPAWMRPYAVLSNGERFRVDLARRLLELDSPIIVDEFSSVVDRQVAKIGSHAVQKYVRKNNKQFIALSCHYDILDWLQPDWVYDVSAATLERRSLRRRPELEVEIRRVPYEVWRMFAPFHYLTAELNKAAKCFALFINETPAAFAGILHRPNAKVRDIKGVSRLVTLPDWQGLGLAFVLVDFLGQVYKACGLRLHTYPAHPALIRGFDKSKQWAMTKRPGKIHTPNSGLAVLRSFGDRPCAVFEYCGPKCDNKALSERFVL
jgi:GNAT superfamily N-acetyltransferase